MPRHTLCHGNSLEPRRVQRKSHVETDIKILGCCILGYRNLNQNNCKTHNRHKKSRVLNLSL